MDGYGWLDRNIIHGHSRSDFGHAGHDRYYLVDPEPSWTIGLGWIRCIHWVGWSVSFGRFNMNTTQFVREPRYFVVKYADIRAALSPEDRKILEELANKVSIYRNQAKKPVFEAVVVEKDWPEYELIWRLIEDRMARG